MSDELDFVVAIKVSREVFDVPDQSVAMRCIALDLRRSWNSQFPSQRVTEITVAGADTNYSISFDLPLMRRDTAD